MGERRFTLVVAVSAVTVLLAGLVVGYHQTGQREPRRAVETYLRALSRGEVSKALSVIDTSGLTDRTLLTKSALPKGSRITRATIKQVRVDGDHAEADISYQVAGSTFTKTLELEPHGRRLLLFRSWRINNGLSSLDVSGADGVDIVVVNGIKVAVKAGKADHPALPGAYTGALLPQFLLAGDSTAAPVSNDKGYLSMSLTVRPEALEIARKAAITGVRACFATTKTLDSPCGAYSSDLVDSSIVYKDVHWKITRMPALTITYDQSSHAVDIESNGSGALQVTFNYSIPKLGSFYLPFHADEEFDVFAKVTFNGRTPTFAYDH